MAIEGLPDAPSVDADEATIEKFFEEVLVHFILKSEEGDYPDIDEYLVQFPRYAEDLAVLLSQHGAPVQEKSDPSTGTRERARGWPLRGLGEFKVEFKVAASGGGSVYKASDAKGRPVALKVICDREVADPREIERFKREAETLATLDDSHVVPLNDLRLIDDAWIIVMPWIEGVSLEELISHLGGRGTALPFDVPALTMEQRVGIIATTARALQKIHDKGVLHRDIKPSNIMVGEDLEPMIIDLGIARDESHSRITMTTDAPLGTPRYLAPEFLEGDAKASSEQSDVYALGMTLYELVVTKKAFGGHDRGTLFREIIEGTVTPAHKAGRGVPRSLSSIVMRAISLDPRERQESMSILAEELEAWKAKSRRGGFKWPWRS